MIEDSVLSQNSTHRSEMQLPYSVNHSFGLSARTSRLT